MFEAFGGGGWAILLHSTVAQGGPADFFGSHGAIRPSRGHPGTARTFVPKTGMYSWLGTSRAAMAHSPEATRNTS